MAMENMDNLENQTQETEVSTTPEVQEQTPEQGQDVQNQGQVEKTRRGEGRYTKLEKSYNELRSFSDRRYSDSQREINELKKQLEFYSPYKDALTKALDDKRQQELANLYQQNPLEAQRVMAQQIAEQERQRIQEQMMPIQQKLAEFENKETIDRTVDYLQSTYGEQAYTAMRPVMSELLIETQQTQGPQVADLLARNPDALFQMAVGRAYMSEISKTQQKQQQGTVNQNKAVQFAKGTAKPAGPSQKAVTSYENMSDAELEKLAYAELLKQNGR